jgi:hypothetical protein
VGQPWFVSVLRQGGVHRGRGDGVQGGGGGGGGVVVVVVMVVKVVVVVEGCSPGGGCSEGGVE